MLKEYLREILKPDIQVNIPSAPNQSTSMVCSVDNCNNAASFKVTYLSNDKKVKVEEYRCTKHRTVRKRDMRENKMAIATGKDIKKIREKTRGKHAYKHSV